MADERRLTANFTADTSGFDPAVDKLIQELKTLNQDLEQNKAKIKDLNGEIRSCQKELDKLNKETENGTKADEKQREKMQSLRESIAQCRTEIGTYKAAQQQLSSQIRTTNTALTEQRDKANLIGTSLDRAGDFADRAAAKFNVLKAALATVLTGAAVRSMNSMLIESNAEMEQYFTSFKTILGSAKEAQTMMNDLRTLAAKTPMELTDVVKSGTLLMNYGTAAENLVDTLTRLGDLAGGDKNKLNSIALAYGQIQSAMRVSTQDLNQLVNAGVPIWQELAKVTGIASSDIRDAVAKNKVSIEDFNRAIEDMTSGSGKFSGMMEAQSQTMNGLLSTMRDNIDQFTQKIGEKGFEQIKEMISGVADEIDRLTDSGELDKLAEELGEPVEVIAQHLKEIAAEAFPQLVDMVHELAESGELKQWADDIGNGIRFVADSLISGTRFLVEHREIVKSTVAAYLTFKAAITVTSAISGTIKTIGEMVFGMKSLATATTTAAAATKTAEAAQLGLNAAQAASGIGLIVTLVATLAAGLITLAAETGKATEKAKELNESADELNRTTADYIKTAENLDDITEKYEEIYRSESNTADKKKELKDLQKQLIDQYPDLADKIDLVNGKYADQLELLSGINAENRDLMLASARQAVTDAEKAEKEDIAVKHSDTLYLSDSESLALVNARNFIKENFAENAKYSGFDNHLTISGNYSEKESILNSLYNHLLDAGYGETEYVQNVLTAWQSVSAGKETLETAQKQLEKIESWDTSGNSAGRTAAGNAAGTLPEATGNAAADSDKYKEILANLEYHRDIGEMTEEQFYNALDYVKDRYLEKDSEEWRKANVQVYKYRNKSTGGAGGTAEDVYKNEKADYKWQFDMGMITEQEYYRKLGELRDSYLAENSTAWRAATLEIHNYEKQQDKERLSGLESGYKATLAAIDAEIAKHNQDKEDEKLNDKLAEIDRRLKYERLDGFDRAELEKQKQELLEEQEETKWQREKQAEKALAEEVYTQAKEAYESSAQQFNGALSTAVEIFKAISGSVQAVNNSNVTNNSTQNNQFLMNLVGSTADEIVAAVKKALSSEL